MDWKGYIDTLAELGAINTETPNSRGEITRDKTLYAIGEKNAWYKLDKSDTTTPADGDKVINANPAGRWKAFGGSSGGGTAAAVLTGQSDPIAANITPLEGQEYWQTVTNSSDYNNPNYEVLVSFSTKWIALGTTVNDWKAIGGSRITVEVVRDDFFSLDYSDNQSNVVTLEPQYSGQELTLFVLDGYGVARINSNFVGLAAGGSIGSSEWVYQ